jgi:hypothetical protein
MPPKRPRRWILWVIGLGFIGIIVAIIVVGGRAIQEQERQERQQEEQYDALKKQRAAQQREFEKTPKGKKVKAAREQAERKAEAERFGRFMLAEIIEKDMLKAGHDIKTGVSEAKLTLYITGEPVNRVFAYQLMHVPKILKNMRDAGFETVTFWNGHQFTNIFTEDYDLTK